MQNSNNQHGQLYHPIYQPVSVPFDFCGYARRKSIYITGAPLPLTSVYIRLEYEGLEEFRYQLDNTYPPSFTRIDASGAGIWYKPSESFFVLFLAAVNHPMPNIVLLVSGLSPKSKALGKPLVSLMNCASIIEFFLEDATIYNPKKMDLPSNPLPVDRSKSVVAPSPSIWSTQIDLDMVATRNCWHDHVIVYMPYPRNGPKPTFRISAKVSSSVQSSATTPPTPALRLHARKPIQAAYDTRLPHAR